METLPIELKREIVKFTPRHPAAQIMHDARQTLSLNYVRRYNFEDADFSQHQFGHRRMFIWEELKPSNLKSIFYGDTKKITRSNISKGQYIQLRRLGVIYSFRSEPFMISQNH